MPTTQELDDMARSLFKRGYNELSSDGKEVAMRLAIQAKLAENTRLVAYATVYGQFPEGYDA